MTGTPAETIKRAAVLMRERAGAANPGPWLSLIEGRDHRGGDDFILTGTTEPGGDGRGEDVYVTVRGRDYNQLWNEDQDHIASWHPLVALAVADWLEASAKAREGTSANTASYALKIALAYLGEPMP